MNVHGIRLCGPLFCGVIVTMVDALCCIGCAVLFNIVLYLLFCHVVVMLLFCVVLCCTALCFVVLCCANG